MHAHHHPPRNQEHPKVMDQEPDRGHCLSSQPTYFQTLERYIDPLEV
jgi:hypothetical protein